MQSILFLDNQKMLDDVDNAFAFHYGKTGAYPLAAGADHIRNVLFGQRDAQVDVLSGRPAIGCPQAHQKLGDLHLDIAIRQAQKSLTEFKDKLLSAEQAFSQHERWQKEVELRQKIANAVAGIESGAIAPVELVCRAG